MTKKAEGKESTALIKMEEAPLAEVVSFKTALDVEHQKYLALQEYLDKHLVINVHYGAVKGIPKPFLHKPGAEAVCKALHLTATFEQTEKQVSEDSGFVLFSYKCQMHHYKRDKDGNVIADEVVAELEASANSFEPGKRYRWVNKERKERDPKDLLSEYHNIMTLAEKRAYVGAAIQAAGISHKFTYAEDAFEHGGKKKPEGPACFECDTGVLVERKGKHGKFFGCTNYWAKGDKKCTYVMNEPLADPKTCKHDGATIEGGKLGKRCGRCGEVLKDAADGAGTPPTYDDPCPKCNNEPRDPSGVCHAGEKKKLGTVPRCGECKSLFSPCRNHATGHRFFGHKGGECRNTAEMSDDEKEYFFPKGKE